MSSVPADWAIVCRIDNNGNVALGFANDQLPEDYLDMVSGGIGGLPPGSARPGPSSR